MLLHPKRYRARPCCQQKGSTWKTARSWVIMASCLCHVHLLCLARQPDNQDTGFSSSRSTSLFPGLSEPGGHLHPTQWFQRRGPGICGGGVGGGWLWVGGEERSAGTGIQEEAAWHPGHQLSPLGIDQRIAFSTTWHTLLLYLKTWVKSQKLYLRVRLE